MDIGRVAVVANVKLAIRLHEEDGPLNRQLHSAECGAVGAEDPSRQRLARPPDETRANERRYLVVVSEIVGAQLDDHGCRHVIAGIDQHLTELL
jgi:hypothetical protein